MSTDGARSGAYWIFPRLECGRSRKFIAQASAAGQAAERRVCVCVCVCGDGRERRGGSRRVAARGKKFESTKIRTFCDAIMGFSEIRGTETPNNASERAADRCDRLQEIFFSDCLAVRSRASQ